MLSDQMSQSPKPAAIESSGLNLKRQKVYFFKSNKNVNMASISEIVRILEQGLNVDFKALFEPWTALTAVVKLYILGPAWVARR